MKIGLDLRLIKGKTYYEQFMHDFALNLVHKDSWNDYTFYVSQKLDIGAKNLRGIIYNKDPLNFLEQKRFGTILKKEEKNDLMIFFNEYIPLNFKWDYFFFLPDLEDFFYTFDKKIFKRFLYQKMLHHSLVKAQKIIVFDEETREELNERFNISEEKIELLPAFFSIWHYETEKELVPIDIRAKYGIKNNFILYDGGAGVYKNLDRTMEVFASLLKEWHDISFLIFGDSVSNDLALRNIILENNIQEPVFFLWEMKQEEEKYFYTQALGVVFPSLYEPFPFELSKAIAYNSPIVASNINSISKIFGDTITYFNPLSRVDMQKVISSFLKKNIKVDYTEVLQNCSEEKFIESFNKLLTGETKNGNTWGK